MSALIVKTITKHTFVSVIVTMNQQNHTVNRTIERLNPY